MTDMKRTTVSFPDEIVDAMEKLRETPEFENCTYSEVIRRLVLRGLDAEKSEGRESA